jgi:hypothetical protein
MPSNKKSFLLKHASLARTLPVESLEEERGPTQFTSQNKVAPSQTSRSRPNGPNEIPFAQEQRNALYSTIQANKQNKLRGSWSASELYRLSDRHLSAKFSANFCVYRGVAEPPQPLISVF